MLDLERSQVISSIKKMDRQGLREISASKEEEEEEDPLPVYNPHGDSEEEAVTDDVSYQDTETDAGPYYGLQDSEESLIQYPVTQQ